MIFPESTIGRDVRKYCAEIGADPLLVQGAGGNVSWKDDSTLWIKASGTCLSNAERENIFIPVDLLGIKFEIAKQNFSVEPKVLIDVRLKPSIETILHALMPHRVVIHLHAVEILAHLIREDFGFYLNSMIDKTHSFAVVEYYKPGAELAMAIDNALKNNPSADIIFMKNHGVVIGGGDILDVHQRLKSIINSFITAPSINEMQFNPMPQPPMSFSDHYTAVADPWLHHLALDPVLYSRLSNNWALYPDHVVFLGAKAHCYESWSEFEDKASHFGLFPELVFFKNKGVFVKKSFTKTKLEQLRCYFDILIRQNLETSLISLKEKQITELLSWDAELYRMNLAS